VFIDEAQVEELERKMKRARLLEGSEMSKHVQRMRGNDLVGSFVVNNYLHGQGPVSVHLLYWKRDPAHAGAHAQFLLRNMYITNLPLRAAGISLNGVLPIRPVQG